MDQTSQSSISKSIMAPTIGFFRLPLELRLEIYNTYLNDAGVTQSDFESSSIERDISQLFTEINQLLRLNHQIYHEARTIACRLIYDSTLKCTTNDFATFKRSFQSLPTDRQHCVLTKLTLLNTPKKPNRFPTNKILRILAKEAGYRNTQMMQNGSQLVYKDGVKKPVFLQHIFPPGRQSPINLYFKLHASNAGCWEYLALDGLVAHLESFEEILKVEH
ncbi:hypothetical protein BT63DRAFT_431 [Microthyrium microscopicum]|uniref:Uncharacterized protein n=1 Tax=Microthyrium microscopicum TaxID=703497 RepID=A0A6A6UP43_9PEZI|nr:hypothetical protein BT63DRAFT_431 [Microthyrium microscopicum]